jgi:DNA-directed RNA polymerase subunit RPC12/RpoP
MEYKCKTCGNTEFITNPNRYDVFQSDNDKLVLKNSELTDETTELFCRECSKKLEFEPKDLIF